jgi:hypothetical protein
MNGSDREEPRDTQSTSEDEQEHVAGYTRVVLAFESIERLSWAARRLHEKASDRFEWGMTDEASAVQNLAGALPTKTEAEA